MHMMNWMFPTSQKAIEFFSAVVLTTLTGGLLTAIWYFVRHMLEKSGRPDMAFRLLKLVMLFYFLPVSYAVLSQLHKRRLFGRGYLFAPSPTLGHISKMLIALWLAGIGAGVVFLLKDVWLLYRRRKELFPCTREEEALFWEIYKQMGGKGRRLTLRRSYRWKVPCVTGLLHPVLILPAEDYDGTELKVIFTHEIAHYLQGDVALEWFAVLMRLLNFYNPMAWLLWGSIRRWSEYACDMSSCRVLGDTKRYFGVIINVAVSASACQRLPLSLFRNKNELVERMRKMKKHSNVKRCSGFAAAMILAVAFMTSTITVSAATLAYGAGYIQLFELTREETEAEPTVRVPVQEYIQTEPTEGVAVRVGATYQITRSMPGIEWKVDPNERVETESFECSKGDKINIFATISPDTATIKIGLIKPNGDFWYIYGTYDANHDFAISDPGSYKVFVENTSDASVSVDGGYRIVKAK